METTPPIQTLTDELLVEIEYAAKEAKIARSGNPWFSPEDCCWWTGNADEGDFMAAVDPATVASLITELRTLRAENAELRKDASRLDWLADLDSPAQVMLPSQFVLDNIHSMRDAIDQCRSAIESTGVRTR